MADGELDKVATADLALEEAKMTDRGIRAGKTAVDRAEGMLLPDVKMTKKERKAKWNEERRKRKNELEDAEGEPFAHLPAIAILAGPGFHKHRPGVVEARILSTHRDRVASNPGMALQGRTYDNFRIDIDPESKSIVGIRSRLKRHLATKDVYDSLEQLLFPVVLMDTKSFSTSQRFILKSSCAAMKDTQKCSMNQRGHTSQWFYHAQSYVKIHLATEKKAADVVLTLLDSLRWRCRKVHPASLLLHSPESIYEENLTEEDVEAMREWSLCVTDVGFAEKLWSCLGSLRNESAEVYEDLLERELYAFKRANPHAVYGAKVVEQEKEAETENIETKSEGEVENDGEETESPVGKAESKLE